MLRVKKNGESTVPVRLLCGWALTQIRYNLQIVASLCQKKQCIMDSNLIKFFSNGSLWYSSRQSSWGSTLNTKNLDMHERAKWILRKKYHLNLLQLCVEKPNVGWESVSQKIAGQNIQKKTESKHKSIKLAGKIQNMEGTWETGNQPWWAGREHRKPRSISYS